MPNILKHSETAVAKALKMGDLYMGGTDIDKGPTSSTGFYNGINPPVGGYTVYMNKASGGPSIVCPANDAELIAFTEKLTGESMADVNACFAYFAGESDKMVMHNPMYTVVTDSLVAYFSPSAIPSYPRSGTTLYDLGSEGHNGTIVNGGTFNSNGWLNLDGVDDEITLSGATSLIQQKTAITLCILFRMETLGSLKGLLGTSNYSCTKNLGLVASNANLQFYNDTTTCMNTATSIVETGKWIYAVGTYDGTTTKIRGFKEGAMQSGQTDLKSGATNSFTSEFQILGANHSGFFTDGDVARASVYQKVLTEAEILQNYHQAAIVTDNLELAVNAGNLMSYTPDETSTTQDLVSSTTGTLTNGVAFSSANAGSWDFDGTDDYITFGNPTDLQYIYTDPFSLEVWCKMGTVSGFKHLIGKTYANYRLAISGNKISFRLDANNLTTNSGNVVAGEWTHIIATWDPSSSTAKVYQDGTLAQSVTDATVDWTSTSSDFQLGNSPSESYYFDGLIAQGRAYGKTLSASEVKLNYNATKNLYN